MNLVSVSFVIAGGLVGETFDMDILGRDTGGYDGPFCSVHPSRAATDEHIVFGHVRDELA
jgi:hypothetical protein